MKKLKILFRRLLRYLYITKPIDLDKSDIFWIKFCKLHYTNKYPFKGNWVDTLRLPFKERYGWSSEDHYSDFLGCMFNRLLDLHLKIQYDQSGSNIQLKEIIQASFTDPINSHYVLSIEKVIAALCGQIQNNTVFIDGVYRYHLDTGGIPDPSSIPDQPSVPNSKYVHSEDTDDCFATHV